MKVLRSTVLNVTATIFLFRKLGKIIIDQSCGRSVHNRNGMTRNRPCGAYRTRHVTHTIVSPRGSNRGIFRRPNERTNKRETFSDRERQHPEYYINSAWLMTTYLEVRMYVCVFWRLSQPRKSRFRVGRRQAATNWFFEVFPIFDG